MVIVPFVPGYVREHNREQGKFSQGGSKLRSEG